jgi:pilus assembly protein CpaE
MARRGGEGGQASVELIAAIPALALITLLVAQLVLAGYALWSAGVAARAGARAAYVGGDAKRAAQGSLPPALRNGASVSERHGVRVRVRAPSLLPGLPGVPVSARTGLRVEDGGGR